MVSKVKYLNNVLSQVDVFFFYYLFLLEGFKGSPLGDENTPQLYLRRPTKLGFDNRII